MAAVKAVGLDGVVQRKDEAETTGYVQRYFPMAGYGFIKNGWGDSLFFNINDAQAGVRVGQDVRFDVVPKGNDRREQAINIWVIK